MGIASVKHADQHGAGFSQQVEERVDGQRIRQVVIGVLILVAFATFWSREVPKRAERSDAPQSSETVTVDTAPAPQEQRQTGGPAIATAAFDYYVLVLSWSPTHCSGDSGRGRDDDLQCRSGRPYGFVLHGLWPQNERGYPENCQTGEPRAVSDAVMNDVLKISPSAQLVQHEWEKHGTCSGLSQADYFATAALAFDAVKVPPAYRAPPRPIVTTPDDVRQAFLDANRSIGKDDLSATCSRNQLAEVWVCLDKDLRARACSNDVRKRHCGARDVRMLAVRGDWPR